MGEKSKALDYSWRHSRFWYVVLRGFFGIVFHTLWPLKVIGIENVPRTGSAIIISNHVSLADPFVIGYAADRLVSYMGKEELFRTPVVGFLIRQVGSFPVNRSRPGPGALRTAYRLLENGELLGMFPEGTRSTTGELQEFRAGVLRVAARSGRPVIPARISGSERAWPPKKWPRPARISVAFGPPLDVAAMFDGNLRGEAMDQALEELRHRVEALTPSQ